MRIQYNEIKNLIQNAEDIRTSFTNFSNRERETFSATISYISSLELARSLGNIEVEINHEMGMITDHLVSIFGFLNEQLENYITIATNAKSTMDSLATKINNAYQASSNATADLYSSFTVASNESLADAYKRSQNIN